MKRVDLEAKLADLGYVFVGPSADPRYRLWRRPPRGKREAKLIAVRADDLIFDQIAERILEDAER